MGDAWIFIPILVVAFLLATPAVRRWLGNGEKRPLVDPEQSIGTEPVLSGTHWLHYRMSFRPRRAARGRSHRPPANPSPTRVRRDPPSS